MLWKIKFDGIIPSLLFSGTVMQICYLRDEYFIGNLFIPFERPLANIAHRKSFLLRCNLETISLSWDYTFHLKTVTSVVDEFTKLWNWKYLFISLMLVISFPHAYRFIFLSKIILLFIINESHVLVTFHVIYY